MTAPIPPAELEPWLSRDDLTLDELVQAAADLLPRIAPSQSRYKVRARPDVRTIRYYTSQGLLPKPLGYRSGRARYGGPHLIRLLLIKRLQAEHLTLARIRTELADATDATVYKRLTEGAPDPAVAPGLAVAPAPAAAPGPVAGAELPGRAFRHLSLSHEGQLLAHLEIPTEILTNEALRGHLSEALRRIAAQLIPTPSPRPQHDEEAP